MILTRTNATRNCMKIFKQSTVCHNQHHQEKLCRASPIIITKFVRLDLGLTRDFLIDEEIGTNLHVIFLLRDPRSVFNSRWDKSKTSWCGFECANDKVHCDDLYSQYRDYLRLAEEFPKKLHLLRFEDFALKPIKETQRLFTAIGIPFTEDVRQFLIFHTRYTKLGENTFRDAKNEIIPWANSKHFTQRSLDIVQESCSKVMQIIGYKLVDVLSNVAIQDALTPYNYGENLRNHSRLEIK